MRTRLALVAAVAASIALSGSGSAADGDGFLTCEAPGGPLGKLVGANPDWTCVEIGRGRAGSADYDAAVRVLRGADFAVQGIEALGPRAIGVVDKAFKAWSAKAGLGIPGRITVLLADPKGLGSSEATDMGEAVVAGDRECVVRLYLESLAAAPGGFSPLDKTLAHELAHCVQFWRNKPQTAMRGQGADWWMEGSAEMLASLVYPGEPTTRARYALFDEQSATVPLTAMSYQSITFWQWAWNRDPKQVFAIWDAMPTGQPGAAAQAAALIAFYAGSSDKDALQRFAQDYLDGKILDATGAKIANPDFGAPVDVVQEGQIALDYGPPLTIWRRKLTTAQNEYAFYREGVTREPWIKGADGAWTTPVAEGGAVGKACERNERVFARLQTEDAEATSGVIAVRKTSDCKACEALAQRDQCLVGQWAIDKAQLAALLKSFAKGGASDPEPLVGGDQDVTVRLGPGGKGKLDFGDYQVFSHEDMQTPGGWLRTSVWVSAVGTVEFDWSSAGVGGGSARFCPTKDESSFQYMVTVADLAKGEILVKPELTPIPLKMDRTDFAYACAGDTVKLTVSGVTMGGVAVEWTLKRLSP